MMVYLKFIILAIMAFVLVGESAAAPTSSSMSGSLGEGSPSARVTTLATFNAAINPFFPGDDSAEVEERSNLLIQNVTIQLFVVVFFLFFFLLFFVCYTVILKLLSQILTSEADIFCLQEIFFSDVQRQIVAAVRDDYPYAFSAQDLNSSTPSANPACTVMDLRALQECVLPNCDLSSSPSEINNCAVFK